MYLPWLQILLLYLFYFPQSSCKLTFITDNEQIKVPSSYSKTNLQVSLFDLPTPFDIPTLNSSFNVFFKQLSAEKLDPNIKTTLENLKTSYKYVLTQLTDRQLYFSGSTIPTKLPCFLDVSILNPSLPKTVIAMIKLLENLTPVQPEHLNDLTDQKTQGFVGTLTYLELYLKVMQGDLHEEEDILTELFSGKIPIFFQNIIKKSSCLKESLRNDLVVKTIEKSSKGPVVTFEITQIFTEHKYIEMIPVPFFNYLLNLNSSQIFKNEENTFVSLSCEQNGYHCKESPFISPCLTSLNSLDPMLIKDSCDFLPNVDAPFLTPLGILTPADTKVNSVGQPQKTLLTPGLINTPQQVELIIKDKTYHFNANSINEFNIEPFSLDLKNCELLLEYITNSYTSYVPTKNEKIVYGTSAGFIFSLVTFLAIFTKFRQKPNEIRARSDRHPVVFRISSRPIV